jgi:hypothetical protein
MGLSILLRQNKEKEIKDIFLITGVNRDTNRPFFDLYYVWIQQLGTALSILMNWTRADGVSYVYLIMLVDAQMFD